MKYIMLSVLFLSLVGCGPIYRTSYQYVPPSTPEGKRELNVCLHEKQSCGQTCQSIEAQCENTVALTQLASDVVDALDKSGDDDNKKHARRSNRCQNKLKNCTSGCDNTYQACYVNAGGQINTFQECVFNCSKV